MPRISGQPGFGTIAKCAFTIDRNSFGADEAGQHLGGDPGGQRQHHRNRPRPSSTAPSEKSSRSTRPWRRGRGRAGAGRSGPRAARFEGAQGGVDEGVGQALHRHQRAAGRAAGAERLAQDPGGEADVASRRLGVERGEQDRMPEPVVERAFAGHAGADRAAGAVRLAGRRPQDAERARDSRARGVPGTRRAWLSTHQGSAAGIRAQASSARRSSGRRSRTRPRPARSGRRPARRSRFRKSERIGVARQQQVVAVVDRQPERRIVVGAAAARRPAWRPRARRRVRRAPPARRRRRGPRARRRRRGRFPSDDAVPERDGEQRELARLHPARGASPSRASAARRGRAGRPPPSGAAALVALRGLLGDDRPGLRDNAPRASRGDGRADLADARVGDRRLRRRIAEPDGGQLLARQVEAAALGVLVDVAQDVGELQRPALVPGEPDAVSASGMPKIRTDSRPTALATRSQ